MSTFSKMKEFMNTVQASFVAPLNEELAGPASTIAPVFRFERVSNIDVLRGIALLGILVLNIDDFGNPGPVHDVPIGTPIDNFAGPHVYLNLALLMIKWMFFEGKMRGLFSMLFGAGVILLTSRAERRGSTNIADIYTRRNLLLLCFGVIHACFIWGGDILFDYGFQALLFLYPARKLKREDTPLAWYFSLAGSLRPQADFCSSAPLTTTALTGRPRRFKHSKEPELRSLPNRKISFTSGAIVSSPNASPPKKLKRPSRKPPLSYPASIIDRAQAVSG